MVMKSYNNSQRGHVAIVRRVVSDREIIVGLQTDAPLKRAIMPNGGLRMVEGGLEAFGFKIEPQAVGQMLFVFDN